MNLVNDCPDCLQQQEPLCPENYLSIGMLARRTGTTTRQINKWTRQGRVTCFQEGRGHRRYPERRAAAEVKSILREGERRGSQ
jgi:DNA-binding transcriptional MerR regulator